MPKDRDAAREVKEVRWIEDGWPVADGDGVYIVSISGGVEFRARCSWHQFIKYHMESERLIAARMAESNVRKFPAPDREAKTLNLSGM